MYKGFFAVRRCAFHFHQRTCVTGLAVKDTGADFALMGQLVILALIQLGGLGIVIFGAVLALLLGEERGQVLNINYSLHNNPTIEPYF